MRRFNRVGAKHYEPVQIVDGPLSRAIIQRPPNIDRPGAEYAAPPITLHRAPDSLIRSGQVLRLPGGDHHLATDHSATKDWVTHHLFRCDRQVTWARQGTALDPVTRLEVNTGAPADLGTMWVMWERVRREFTDLTMRIDQESHLLATGADVLIDDIINGMTVRRVDTALGVKIVELKG